MNLTAFLTQHFAFEVRRWREKRGWTQKQLAKRIGVDREHVSVRERGLSAPTLQTAYNYAQALKIPVRYLVAPIDVPYMKSKQQPVITKPRPRARYTQ